MTDREQGQAAAPDGLASGGAGGEEPGFAVPPGLASALSSWVDDHYAAAMEQLGEQGPLEAREGGYGVFPADELLATKRAAYIEVACELLMDAGVIPDTRPPLPWRTRLRFRLDDLREHAARRAYRIIAGEWPADGREDW